MVFYYSTQKRIGIRYKKATNRNQPSFSVCYLIEVEVLNIEFYILGLSFKSIRLMDKPIIIPQNKSPSLSSKLLYRTMDNKLNNTIEIAGINFIN